MTLPDATRSRRRSLSLVPRWIGSCLVAMGVVHVGQMRMLVRQPFMLMPMGMRLSGRVARSVRVLVVEVVQVRMVVRHWLVHVFVFMNLRQVKPHAKPHQAAGDDQLQAYRLTEKHDRSDRAHERRRREICPGPSRPQPAQRHDKQRQAHPVAQKADEACPR